jgi:hypothetical protein
MGLRGPKAKDQKTWMPKVAELMIKEHMSFSAACQALGVKFDNTAAEQAAEFTDAFQNIVDLLGFKFHARIGNNPLLTKEVMAGWLVDAIRRLGQQNQFDKIAIPAKLLSDIKGWTKEQQNTPLILNLTQKDLEELKEKAQKAAEEEKNGDIKPN